MERDFGEPLERFVDEQIASGRYASTDEVIRAALELLREQAEDDPLSGWDLEELRREIQKGIDSGPGIPSEEVFAEMQ